MPENTNAVSRFRKNAVLRPYTFRVVFKDGRTEEITVRAESYHSAVYSLPAGKKRYEHVK